MYYFISCDAVPSHNYTCRRISMNILTVALLNQLLLSKNGKFHENSSRKTKQLRNKLPQKINILTSLAQVTPILKHDSKLTWMSIKVCYRQIFCKTQITRCLIVADTTAMKNTVSMKQAWKFLCMVSKNKKLLHRLWRQTTDRTASAGKAHFWKILSVTLTTEPTTLKCHQHPVDLIVSNCHKSH